MNDALRITPLAREDIIILAEHIAMDSIDAADRFLDAVQGTCEELVHMPEIGSSCRFKNEKASGIRVKTVPGFENHLIFYRPSDDGLLIVRVLHGARDWQNLFEQ